MPEQPQIELRTNSLTLAEREAMWRLYAPFYHYTRDDFMRRIPGNTHYALYWRGEALVGFTGLRLQDMTIAGREHFLVYFGQTVVAPEVRGKGLINRTGWLLFRRFWTSFLHKRTYFWADALSYRAYLGFAKNLIEYYPSYRTAVPAQVNAVRAYLGEQYYGDHYCATTGTISKPAYLIRDHRVQLAPAKLADPDIRFYASANPRQAEGHGLLTLAPIHLGNLAHIGCKVLRRALYGLAPQCSVKQEQAA